MDSLNIRPPGAKLTTGEVLEIAKQEGKRHHLDLGYFNKPVAYYEFGRKGDNTWVVCFDGRSETVGDHFMVRINDKTKEAFFDGGR